MSTHEAQYGRIPLYVQNELTGEELEQFQAHLMACPDCAAELQEEQTLSAVLRQSSPLYEAPAECAERVRELLAQHRTRRPAMPAPLSRRTSANDWRLLRLPLLMKRWRVLVPAIAVIALCLLILPSLVQQARADSYVNTAVTSYHQAVGGRLAFGIRSNSSKEVTAWISGRVPFQFRLPIPENPNEIRPAYRLTGASLIKIKGHTAALITYKNYSEQITLLVASDQYATVAGGHRIRHQDLMFHYFTVDAATVITWSNHGLSYALVTSNSSSDQGLKPCLVCHQNMTDRQFFQFPNHH